MTRSRLFATRLLLCLLISVGGLAPLAVSGEKDAGKQIHHAVVFLYHHVSKDTPASTSVSPDQFKAHLDYLEKHDYHVLPLGEIVTKLQAGKPLPPRTVALTFDDAYESIYETAHPMLKKRGMPYTVFVSTDGVDEKISPYMSWDQLRKLSKDGATIENHTATHAHLVRKKKGEAESEWKKRIKADVGKASERIKDEIGRKPELFAYPYGEATPAVEEIVKSLGLVGLGQQSGPIGPSSDFLFAPRFPMASDFAAMDSFETKLKTRPLPVESTAPESGIIPKPSTKPSLTLTLAGNGYRKENLACYASGQGRAETKWQDGDKTTVEVTAKKPFSPGRAKFNCTAPAEDGSGEFYWYSFLWMVQTDDGGWYSE